MKDNAAFFVDRYKELGWEYSPVALKPCIRVNTLKTSSAKLIPRLEKRGVKLTKISSLQDGFIAEASFSLASTMEYLLGLYHIQRKASQIPAEWLAPYLVGKSIGKSGGEGSSKGGVHVLDMCAAPGSKTTHLAQVMKNKGVIVAIEKKRERMIGLKNNIERLGVGNVISYHMDALKVGGLGLDFDIVLLDAPCSGNFAIDKDWFKKRDLDGVKKNAALQRKLFKEGVSVLKPGGYILYSTCSLEPEENEENVAWFTKQFTVELVKQERFWPGETQGFFIALLKKKE